MYDVDYDMPSAAPFLLIRVCSFCKMVFLVLLFQKHGRSVKADCDMIMITKDRKLQIKIKETIWKRIDCMIVTYLKYQCLPISSCKRKERIHFKVKSFKTERWSK